ncbi:hypothetical protein PVK73_26665, partial [Bacillus thuringiensis]
FFSNSTSIAKFERAFSNHFAFLHQNLKMITGIEAMHMIKKGQTLQGEKSVQKQIYLINELFGLTA